MRYEFGGLIFGGAYTWRGLFSEFTVVPVMWACKVLVEIQPGLGCNSVLGRLKSLGVATRGGWVLGRKGWELKMGTLRAYEKLYKCWLFMLYLFNRTLFKLASC